MNVSKRTKIILLLTASIVLLGILFTTLAQKPIAPPVTFTTLQGEKISLDTLRGKVVLINFWATSCPGCIKEMPQLIDTHTKYHTQGYETIAVAMSYDPPNYVVTYTEKNALPFIVSLDINGDIAQAFGNVKLTPTSFLIDKQGNIALRTVGELDFAKLHLLIEEKLKGAL